MSNPTIEYRKYTFHYAYGTTKEFCQIGMNTNTSGISIDILGLDGKTYFANAYEKQIRKTCVTSYCIALKALKNMNITILEEVIHYRFNQNL